MDGVCGAAVWEDERGGCEKFILRLASLLDYSDRLLAQFNTPGFEPGNATGCRQSRCCGGSLEDDVSLDIA
jgi:hypothetical protein